MTDIIESVMPVIEMPVMPPPSAEQIAQNYKAMGDSVDLINQYVAGNFPEGMKPEEVLEVLSKALANKFVHHPSQALNEARGEEHELLTKTLKKIYPLND